MQKEKNEITFDEYSEYEVITGTCNHQFPMHIHQSTCLGMITKGNVMFICDNKKTKLIEGEQYFIMPNSPHSFIPINSNTYSYLTICIKNKRLNAFTMTDFIDQSISFIENADLSILSIDDVCRFVNVSKFHFIRTFKNEIGITPYQYILNLKIRKIKQGIVLQQSLSDLAFNYGFSDQSHLCNTFKRHMGVSLLQYATKRFIHYNNAGENFAKI